MPVHAEGTSNMETLLRNATPEVAAALRAKCTLAENDQLTRILNGLLSASNDIDDRETIDWLTWLVAGGSTPETFAPTARLYDGGSKCNRTWPINYIGYRCKTCAIAHCMSLCTECFLQGDHKGHDFIVFRSDTGGMCDCGETKVIKESGCCWQHGPKRNDTKNSSASTSPTSDAKKPPAPLMEVLNIAAGVMPYLFLRLIKSLREEIPLRCASPPAFVKEGHEGPDTERNLNKGHEFVKMLQEFTGMGEAMLRVITQTLIDPSVYENVRSCMLKMSSGGKGLEDRTQPWKTFLEELLHWTVKHELPGDLTTLLLSMRAESKYRRALTKSFIKQYGFMFKTVLKSSDPDAMCNSAVLFSVQLFSIENLALKMVEEERLLHMILASFHSVMEGAMQPFVNGGEKSCRVLDCDHLVVQNSLYWPMKSDLRQLLTFKQVAYRFLEDEQLLKHWFDLLSRFHGANIVEYIPVGRNHIEQETNRYVALAASDIEMGATILWTILGHLTSKSTGELTQRSIRICWKKLEERENAPDMNQSGVSFHLPLYRNAALFIHQGMRYQHLQLHELLPSQDSTQLKTVALRLIRLQSAYLQILGRMWPRNGVDVFNEATAYVGFGCNATIDADIFLLQILSTRIPRKEFLSCLFEEFHLLEALQESPMILSEDFTNADADAEAQRKLLEQCLLFLATLATSRIYLGLSDEDLMRLELSRILAQGDKLHSEIRDALPERCGSDAQYKTYETVLAQVAEYHAPRNMHQGKYVAKASVWEDTYDPIHTLMRMSERSEFQNTLDRFQDYAKRSKIVSEATKLWPPFRVPSVVPPPQFCDPRHILISDVLLETLHVVLVKCVGASSGKMCSSLTMALTVYLLELGVSFVTSYPTEQEEKCEYVNATAFMSKLIAETEVSYEDPVTGSQVTRKESIVTLLIKLYSILKGPSSGNYSIPQGNTVLPVSRVGDGGYFVKMFLDKVTTADPSIFEYTAKVVQGSTPVVNDEKEREERRRRAKERKLQVLAEYANAMKRQQFMHDMEESEVNTNKEKASDSGSEESDYQCVVCLEKGESKPDNPFGLIINLTPANILAHRRPSNDAGLPKSEVSYREIWNSVLPLYQHTFDESSFRLTVPTDLGTGVSIQTCGHHLHTDCFNSYVNSLMKSRTFTNQRNNTLTRFQCPMCRSSGNSFLPHVKESLSSSMSTCSSADISSEECANELKKSLKKKATLMLSPKQKRGVEKFLSDLNSFVMSYQKDEETSSIIMSPQATCSVFLNCLRMEMLRIRTAAEGSRSCLTPLYSALRYAYKSLPAGHGRKLSTIWDFTCGAQSTGRKQKELPTLLQDVELLLTHLALQLPVGMQHKFFDVIVSKLCVLKIVQVLYGLCISLDQESFSQLQSAIINSNDTSDALSYALSLICQSLKSKGNYEGTAQAAKSESLYSTIAPSLLLNRKELDSFVTSRIQSFLHKSVFLKSFICHDEGDEMNLFFMSSTSGGPLVEVFLSQMMNSITPATLEKVVPIWIEEMASVSAITPSFLTPHLVNWGEPKLIDLHSEYDAIFQKMYNAACSKCSTVPKEPGLCLVCKKLICLTSYCCLDKDTNLTEVVQHSMECGMGTGVYLCIYSSSILVVSGYDCATWGSIYLDSYGETDVHWQRGKSLFLNTERYDFLQRQWATNAFSKSELRWFPHKNNI